MILQALHQLTPNVDWSEVYQATIDTLNMLGFSILFSTLIGIPLGVLLYLTSKKRLLQNIYTYNILSFIVNVLRSIPFIILLIVLIPTTTFLVGTSLGVKGVIPPLVFGAFPFFARLIEYALNELDNGIIDMAKSCGASTWQIIWHILLPEILPGIISSITVMAIALVSYTAMAGTVGGGGLGDMAIRYGYQRFQTDVMVVTVVLMIAIVQIIQFGGDSFNRFLRKK